jgi:NTE family protein
MVQIGTDYYWDGGIVSNTPLQHLLAQETRRNMLVFQVDLFSSRGALPREMAEVMARRADITYASAHPLQYRRLSTNTSMEEHRL